jgi:hypothetical protein
MSRLVRFEVVGPCTKRSALSENAAINVAQRRAELSDDPGTWHVIEWDEPTWTVTRDEQGVVITRAA